MTRKEAVTRLTMHLMDCGFLMPIAWVEKNGEGSKFMEAMQMALDALNENGERGIEE